MISVEMNSTPPIATNSLTTGANSAVVSGQLEIPSGTLGSSTDQPIVLDSEEEILLSDDEFPLTQSPRTEQKQRTNNNCNLTEQGVSGEADSPALKPTRMTPISPAYSKSPNSKIHDLIESPILNKRYVFDVSDY